ncbi:MAG: TraB/GumN family protein [Chromatiales bacterium]|jgi:pheromone shutdown-related protein TraB|nr:TraB/GumN family protein [Chromatiales bacterium]MDX9768399.1 TraB/GumN family protein [Ectothiorhodospiraceae bacterium]
MNDPNPASPHFTVTLNDTQVTVLGTAHVSRASADEVRALMGSGEYDAIAVELCPSRYNALVNPDALARMDLLQVLRQGKVPMVTASLALGAYQQRLAEEFGIEPGAEMRAAIECAKSTHHPALLIDREVGVTLKRCYRAVPWWQRFGLFSGLLASVVSREKVTEEQVEQLKESDVLEATFAQFLQEAPELYRPLIDERDRYMAARLREETSRCECRHLLAVVGAGHVKGIRRYLEEERSDPAAEIAELDREPKPARWPKVLPWVIVALILTGFVIGFARSPQLGFTLVLDWVLINGGLAAIGAAIAMAHPLTTLSAFLAAPFTSLNPTIGVGFVTAAVEAGLRKPSVGDFAALRRDTMHLKGWWRNKVSRVLLVFLLSTIGSAAGTYIAGFRIFDRLVGG